MSELQTINSGINAIWQYAKQYTHAPQGADDNWWAKIVDEAEAIGRRFNHPAVISMMCGYLDYLEKDAEQWQEKHKRF